MKKSVACLLFALAAGIAAAAPNVTNSVMMVGQRGNLNVEGVASVAEVASNAVKVTIAEEKAAAAQAAANGVTAALQTVAGNIMSNNVVIYRSGFSDSFSALVIFTPSDYLAIIDARWIEQGPSRIVVDVDYVSTADIGLVKPLVYHRNTLTNLVDFYQLADANVTMPVYHAESRTYKDDTFAGYYTIRATIPNPTGTDSYFLWIRVEGDMPSGDGLTLDLPNGVTGGYTGEVEWGDKVLTFKGGMLTGVADAE